MRALVAVVAFAGFVAIAAKYWWVALLLVLLVCLLIGVKRR